jgi:hypothetical protein
MAASFSLDTVWSYWPILLSIILGLAVAGLSLFVCRTWQRSRHAAWPPQTDETGSTPADPFEEGSASERRTAARRAGRHVRVYISDAKAESPSFEGWVIDRSLGGVCVTLGRQVPPDTILSIRAYNAADTIPWTQVRVLRCQSQGTHFQIGCQFLRTPPWNAMMLFG